MVALINGDHAKIKHNKYIYCIIIKRNAERYHSVQNILRPMIKFSSSEMTPREATLQFLKFFARNYMPLEIPEAGSAPMVMN